MKANELMIGDFVTRQNYENKAVVCKIIGLSKNSISVEFDNGSRSMGASEDSISPIPLTTEILEKNGFVKYDGGYKFFKSNDENYYFGFESIFFNEETNLMNVTKEMCSGKQTSIKGYFNYVHKLQHALKLCGIVKTIEL